MVFFALGEALRTGTHKAMILDYLIINDMSHLKVDYYGATRAAAQLGSAFSALLGILIVFSFKSYNYVFLFSIIPYVLGFLLIATYPDYIDRSSKKEKLPQIKDFFSLFFVNLKKLEVQKAILNATSFDSLFSVTKDYIQPILKALALSLPFFIGIKEEIHREAFLLGIAYFIIYIAIFLCFTKCKIYKR